MKKPEIKKENVSVLYDGKYVSLFDLEFEPEKHYLDASRRKIEDLAAVKNDEEFAHMLPDAVSCIVILRIKGQPPRLCLNQEFRYPTGRFLLSVPAGLIDPEEKKTENPIFCAAKRELQEETGIRLERGDRMTLVNPLLFSTPGMTDESNALVQIVLERDKMPTISQEGAEGCECFDGFILLTKAEAMEILKAGVDGNGIFYSVYTWAALMCFISDIW